MGKQKEEEEKKDRTALLLQERKKIICNLVLILAASFAVLIGVLTMAWFASNPKVSGTNMSVTVRLPDSVKISLGQKNGDYLVGYDIAPVSESDWVEQIDVGSLYSFGRLIPASSKDGKYILFTPDSNGNGRGLEAGYKFYVATGKADNGNKTDGDLKLYHVYHNNSEAFATGEPQGDLDKLMATPHVLTSESDAWGAYRQSSAWYDTNDDGYYVDIPIWLKTNLTSEDDVLPLKVEGFVEKGKTGDALYKSVRVAIIKSDKEPAVSNQLIPLKADSSSGNSILDSYNYTVYRDQNDTITDANLVGRSVTTEPWDGSVEPTSSYQTYEAYNNTTALIELPVADGSEWGTTVKYYIRIWIDGEDEQCYDPTAGQDWIIHLMISMIQ